MRFASAMVVLLFMGNCFSQDIEKRTAALAHELRCLVCQNQSLAESNAPLAVDLRGQIREQLAAGKSESEVKDYMVARYGDFVLYRPPFNLTTLLLWGGPFLFLLIGVLVFRKRIFKKTATIPLSDEDRARAAKLLE
jgi:cytochrome c-type biogenesis protein CcmH